VAAIPGRVTSPLSHGTNALLMDGASLVRGPRDVLELLFELSDARPKGRPCGALAAGAVRPVRLRPTLARVLDRVGAGYDTPDKLTRAGVDARQVLPALTELELTGLLSRGDGGRYLPREPLD
jgi:DNA processing protein